MAKKIDEIEIDLSFADLYGHDFCLDDLNCKVLGFLIDQARYVLPGVDVVLNNGVYQLLYGEKEPFYKNYAGHSRSRASLDNELFLKCNLWDKHAVKPFRSFPEKRWVKISEMELKDFREPTRLGRVQRNMSYLPENLANRFMEDNGLILDEDGFLIDTEDVDFSLLLSQ